MPKSKVKRYDLNVKGLTENQVHAILDMVEMHTKVMHDYSAEELLSQDMVEGLYEQGEERAIDDVVNSILEDREAAEAALRKAAKKLRLIYS